MAIKEGDRVRIVTRPVTAEDRKNQSYYAHMAGLEGTVQNIYAKQEIAVRVDPQVMVDPTKRIHGEATKRMRERFVSEVGEAARSQLTDEEIKFPVNYMMLVRETDLEKI